MTQYATIRDIEERITVAREENKDDLDQLSQMSIMLYLQWQETRLKLYKFSRPDNLSRY